MRPSTKNVVVEELQPLYLLNLDARIIGSVIHEFDDWVQHNGIRWAIARMKTVKVDYLRYLTHADPVSGVRRNRRNKNLPYGVFGLLYQMPKKKRSQVLRLLNLYTKFKLEPVLRDAVEAEQHIIPVVPWSMEMDQLQKDIDRTALFSLGHKNKIGGVSPLLTLFAKEKKTSPGYPVPVEVMVPGKNKKNFALIYRGPKPGGKRNRGTEDLETDIIQYKMNKRFFLDIPGIEHILTPFEEGLMPCAVKGTWPKEVLSGEINFVQDSGKLRYVAAPYRYLQLITKPLGDLIYAILRTLPWDFTFNQLSAIPQIIEKLGKSGCIYSYDLNKASDHIPLEGQIRLLKTIIDPFYHNHINLWEVISKGLWYWKEFPERSVRWGRGQPLGLYPSFGSFSLWHGFLLKSLTPGIWNGEFFVLGDDILITNYKLAMKYEQALSDFQIPISWNKSLSGPLGEFAGQVISEDGIVQSIKWDFSHSNIIQIGTLLGPRVLRFLDSTSRKLLRRFGDLLPPVGCNWFSKRSYTEKIFLTDNLLNSEEFVVYGNPESQLRQRLNCVTKNLLNLEQVEDILHRLNDEADKDVGFKKSVISRDFLDVLMKTRKSISPSLVRNFAFSEKDWLEGLLPILQTLEKQHKQAAI